jgi:ABC-type sugar transport system substrate-binding protein
MFKRTTTLIASAVLALCLAGTALADSNAWIRVIMVKTDNVSAYMQQLDKGRAMMKRLGINSTLHVYKATFAGSGTGQVVVTQEYASWTALSDAQAKTAADPEFAAWLKNLDNVRTIVSDSLYRELM